MIGLTVLSLTALHWQSASQIRIVPSQESSQAPKQRFTRSASGDLPGMVLFTPPGVSNQRMTNLQSQMSGAEIIIVRKVSKGSFAVSAGFDLRSFREARMWGRWPIPLPEEKDGQISKQEKGGQTTKFPDYFDSMIEGDVVAIVQSVTLFNMTHRRSDEPTLTFGPYVGEAYYEKVTNILELGTPAPGYINIPFQATFSDNMGLIWHGVGSQLTTDGVRFTVLNQSRVGIEEPHPFRVTIRQEGRPVNWSYDFESKWSNGTSLEESRQEFLNDLKKVGKVPQYQLPPSSFIQEFIVDCGQPFKFWNGIAVHRTTKISGFFSHIKIP